MYNNNNNIRNVAKYKIQVQILLPTPNHKFYIKM